LGLFHDDRRRQQASCTNLAHVHPITTVLYTSRLQLTATEKDYPTSSHFTGYVAKLTITTNYIRQEGYMYVMHQTVCLYICQITEKYRF